MPAPGPDPNRAPADAAYAVFRPVRARRVAWGMAVVFLAAMTVLALVVPGAGLWDRVGFVVTGLLVAWFLSRQAGVRAVPSPEGLVVRNLFLSRTLEWPQVVSVRFGPDTPWVQLDLADGDTLSVMAIQRSDGQRADGEARRLAALVARGSRTPRDD